MHVTAFYAVIAAIVMFTSCGKLLGPVGVEKGESKPDSAKVIALLKAGNERFAGGHLRHPHADRTRLSLASAESQNNYAYATVLSCSDSRVPVEQLFDAGIMDIFVVRVAGNVCDIDEAGSVEYGLSHVKTPVLVVLGHSQCGAVTAVTHAIEGKGHALERNIPTLVDNIEPAVKRAMAGKHGDEKEVIAAAIEENVWQSIEDLFMKSASTRELVKSGAVKVVGAVYHLETGKVEWLSETKVAEILARAEASPDKVKDAMAGGGEEHGKKKH